MKKESPALKHSKGPACRQAGFTLVELLIVVSIIVILGIIALIGINPMTQLNKANDAHRRQDLARIKVALESYSADHEHYPVFPLADPHGNPTYACESSFLAPYLSAIPCDPNTKLPYKVYLVPVGSTQPTQFAVYADIAFAADPQANLITSCPKTIAVHSPDMSVEQLNSGCEP